MAQLLSNIRSNHGRLVLLAVLWLAVLPAPGFGQGTASYFKERTFSIPFEVSGIQNVKQFFLYVSTDLGKSYTSYVAAAPNSGGNSFTYTATGDGWYYFVVQVEDLDGRRNPENVNLAPPGLKVCVDTTRPIVTLKPVAPTAGHTVAVEWEVNDINLDLATLKLEYAPQGSDRWEPLKINQLVHAQFSWKAPAGGTFDVRLQVSDLAHNDAIATTRVGVGAASSAGAATAPIDQHVKHVHSRKFKLNYTCDNEGPSGVKRVEIWMTRDTRSWLNFKKDAPAKGPCELEVPSAGRYGFTLRPINGVGRGPETPVPGQLPQIWIEVDEEAPKVIAQEVIVGEGTDTGFITVRWQASDKWFPARPITLSYSESPTGPWIDLPNGKDLENTGSCRCSLENVKPYQFYVRIKAVDEAGNEGYAVSKMVTVDLKIPRIKDVGVEAAVGDSPPKPQN